jgi:hypothetical protein
MLYAMCPALMKSALGVLLKVTKKKACLFCSNKRSFVKPGEMRKLLQKNKIVAN